MPNAQAAAVSRMNPEKRDNAVPTDMIALLRASPPTVSAADSAATMFSSAGFSPSCEISTS